MKKPFIFLFILFIINTLAAQKNDYFWVVGSGLCYVPAAGNSCIDFNQIPKQIDTISGCYVMDGGSTISMCDGSGNFVFGTNGKYAWNRYGQQMPHGDSLSFGPLYDLFDYLYIHQGIVALPAPSGDNKFYLFHVRTDFAPAPYLSLTPYLYFSVVDMDSDGGLGDIVEKNHLILSDSLTDGQITAVKHANGRDWWIVIPEDQSNCYYSFLLGIDGISGPYHQCLGFSTQHRDRFGQAAFSPDGERYARYDVYNDLNIMDFDRCTGLFSNPIHVPVDDSMDIAPQGRVGGVSISPTGRFVYVSSSWYLYQYDLDAVDVESSRITLDTMKPIVDCAQPTPFSRGFSLQQNGPDGKVYICGGTTMCGFHIINYPDSVGFTCGHVQGGLQTPTPAQRSIPLHPNYRLGPLLGSPCDTITSVAQPVALAGGGIRIYPNPASGLVKIEYPPNPSPQTLQIFDALGRIVLSQEVTGGSTTIDTTPFGAGVYGVVVEGYGAVKLLVVY